MERFVAANLALGNRELIGRKALEFSGSIVMERALF